MEETKNVGSFLNNVEEKNQFVLASQEKYFVDKTGMIGILNDSVGKLERYICITRPRRFGKSINAAMIASYYTKNLDMSDVFGKLNISKCDSYEKHLNKHNVIYISFDNQAEEFKTYDEYINYFKRCLKKDLKEFYQDVPNDMLVVDMLNYVYTKTKQKFIFVIDEWDYIFNNEMYKKDDRDNFLKFLKSLLKDKAYVELAYMTGILPISKNSSGSSINMFKEYNAVNDTIYSKYFGFLEEEVEELCKKQDKVTMQELREWYDGYYTQEGEHIYNPRSVVYALQDGGCQSYWTKTGKMKEVSNYINANIAGVKDDILAMMSGEEISIRLGGFDAESKASYKEKSGEEATRDLILSGMTVLGFLSYYTTKENIELSKITGGEPGKYLKIPNRELMLEFDNIITSGDVGGFVELVNDSKEMLQATLDKDTKKMEEILEKIHEEHCSYLEYNKEIALSFVVKTAYLYASTQYVIKKEDVSAKGRADFAFYPMYANQTSFIIELKKDKTPEEAIEQIKDRKYFATFKNFKGKKLLVGITYDTKGKKHNVKIEELE